MGRHSRIPEEVENITLDHLIGDHPTLAICGLVSKRWLHESRRRLFLTREVGLTTIPSRYKDELIQELLGSEATRECTFWPYIRRLEIYDDSGGDSDSDDSLADENSDTTLDPSMALVKRLISHSPNLQQIRIAYFNIKEPRGILFEAISASTALSTLSLRSVTFTSPESLLIFIESLQHISSEFELEDIAFNDDEWDPTTSKHFIPTSALGMKICFTEEGDDIQTMFTLILNHQWNIRSLRVEKGPESVDDIHSLERVTRHIGDSLKSLVFNTGDCCDPEKPIPITLSNNTSLSMIGVGPFYIDPDEEHVPSIWLTSLLNAIPHPNRFEEIQLSINTEVERDGFDWKFIECFDWKPVEDMLVDATKFPGNKVVLSVIFYYSAEFQDDTEKLMRKQCLPRLEKAGRLKLDWC